MALASHWLDDIFNMPPSRWGQAVERHPVFQEAIRAAQDAYNDQVEWLEKHIYAFGASPSQKARLVFLERINNPRGQNT